MTPELVNDILSPLYDLGDFAELNFTWGRRLAELIHPRDARDLTVRELLVMLETIQHEQIAPIQGGAA